MSRTKKVAIIVQGGREFTSEEIEHIKTVVEMFPRLCQAELVDTLCEHLAWSTASGAYKQTACLKLLKKLEKQGIVELPAARSYVRRPKRAVARTKQTDRPAEEIVGRLADVAPVSLEMVQQLDSVRLWNRFVDRYHYLGYKKPFGCTLRYFVVSERNRLGCVLLAGASKSIGIRDRWIGWTKRQRLKNLPWVINNTRFLLFPWVKVKHLASHVLGQLSRRVGDDWHKRWGYRPVLLETFVDPERFQGTCYRAAGWLHLGQTTGVGLQRAGARLYTTTPKMMFVRPLVPDFRALLCSDSVTGRLPE